MRSTSMVVDPVQVVKVNFIRTKDADWHRCKEAMTYKTEETVSILTSDESNHRQTSAHKKTITRI